MEKKPGFMAACKTFFGMLPGQNLQGFRDEMHTLTAEDKMDIWEGFQAHDPIIDCEKPSN